LTSTIAHRQSQHLYNLPHDARKKTKTAHPLQRATPSHTPPSTISQTRALSVHHLSGPQLSWVSALGTATSTHVSTSSVLSPGFHTRLEIYLLGQNLDWNLQPVRPALLIKASLPVLLPPPSPNPKQTPYIPHLSSINNVITLTATSSSPTTTPATTSNYSTLLLLSRLQLRLHYRSHSRKSRRKPRFDRSTLSRRTHAVRRLGHHPADPQAGSICSPTRIFVVISGVFRCSLVSLRTLNLESSDCDYKRCSRQHQRYLRSQPHILPIVKVDRSLFELPDLRWHRPGHARDGISNHHLRPQRQATDGQ
jgi:hypothetical protein